MSSGKSCRCDIRSMGNWIVRQRNYNLSHFETPKGQPHYSDYSLIECLHCGALWRTKAKYVSELKESEGKE